MEAREAGWLKVEKARRNVRLTSCTRPRIQGREFDGKGKLWWITDGDESKWHTGTLEYRFSD